MDRPLWIGQEFMPGRGDVTLAPDHNEIARRVDEPTLLGGQNVDQAAAGHHVGRGEAGGFEERRRQVGQVHEIVDHTAGRNAVAPAHGQRHVDAQVVQVALAPWKAGDAVIAADDHERVVQLADALEFLDQHAEGRVESLGFAEIVAEIFSNDGDVGQIGRQLPFQVVGIEAPEVFARPLDPFPVGVGWAKPVAEGPPPAVGQEVAEIAADLVHDLPFGGLAVLGLADELRVAVDVPAATRVGVGTAAVGSVSRRARRPDLVGVADVIAVVSKDERVGGDRIIPDGSLEDRAEPGPPEVLPREERAAARGARGGVDESVGEQHPLAGDAVEVGRGDQVARSARLEFCIRAGVAAPVVGKGE